MIKFDDEQIKFLKKMLKDYTVSEIYAGADTMKDIDLYQGMYEQYCELANKELQNRVKRGELAMATSV